MYLVRRQEGKRMNEPFVIEPTLMKSVGDCAICCLRMLTGNTYAEVVAAVPRRERKTFMESGISVLQAINIARKLGVELEYHDDDFNPDYIGILVLRRTVNNDMHAVMWLGNGLYNPADGNIYTDLETYLTKCLYRVEGFLFIKRRL